MNSFKIQIFFLLMFLSVALFAGIITTSAQAYGECDQYGPFSMYESWSNSCKCMSGYVFSKNFLGEPYCVDASSVCRDEYGIHSRFNSLNDSCECSYGYIFAKDSLGRTQCISDDQVCRDQLGYNSRATYDDKCECDYGYVIDNGQCVDGDRVCRDRHGLYSDYDTLSNKCECDDGYTLDNDNQCVKKHNSAYFILLDINEEDEEILVQSKYDFQNYILEYGLGCWDYALESYGGRDIVINMGTDFSVDMFDTIVLSNYDQTCSIMGIDYTSEDSFDEPDTRVYIPPTPQIQTITPTVPPAHNKLKDNMVDGSYEESGQEKENIDTNEEGVIKNTSTSSIKSTTTTDINLDTQDVSFGKKIINWFLGLFK